MENLLGQHIDIYRLDAIVGSGGMGTVFRAYDMNLDRSVALKIMRQQYASQSHFQQRFQQEARAAARLSHPSIVRVYHFGQYKYYHYLVMEYVPGLSLGSYMKQLAQHKQVIKLNETLTIIAQVADALGYAHRQGVIHRDIKPDNILIKPLDQPERPNELPLRSMVTDFGLAKLMDGGMETQTGTFMGTLPYMSPEYVLDKPLDGRSDIYSLGVVLYQLATGKLPFTITTPTEAVMKHLNDIPTAPYEHQPGLPTGVSTLILKSLAKEPENRYQTAEEFAHSLRETNLRLTDDQSTDFATDSDVISVVTSLHERRQVLAKIETVSYEPPGDYRLVITEGDHTPHSHKLNQFTLVLGRAHDCDVVLNGDNVSRYHARLEWNGRSWQLTDLGSTNGTYLDNNPLIPEKPVNWSPTQTVKLGVFYLQLQTADAPAPPIYQSPIYQSPTPPANRYSFDFRPKQINKQATCRVLIINMGDTATTYTATITAPDGKLDINPSQQTITLQPNQRGTVDFVILAHKRGSKTRPFHVTVSNGTHTHTLAGTAKV
jgi:serine/threonine protein kinase